MKRKSLLIMLLVALFVPLAMNAQKGMTLSMSPRTSSSMSPKMSSNMSPKMSPSMSPSMSPMQDLSSMERIELRDFFPTTHSDEYDNRDMRAVGDYELVTASQTDWSGEYVIAYVASSTSAKVLSGKASGNSNYGVAIDATISNNVLAASNVASYKVTIEKLTYNNSTVYTIKQGSNYLGLTSTTNGRLYFATSLPTSNTYSYYWTISYSNNTLKIFNVRYNTKEIQWNNASNGLRFACYASTQQPISLFKRIESSCAKPQNLAVDETSITTNSATITWTAGDATRWNLRYKTTDASTWTTVNGLTAATYTFSGLISATEYEVEVQADCGDEQSDWVPESFMTECEVKSLPFFCGFETTEQIACWSGFDLATNTTISNSNYHSGSYCFYFAANSDEQLLISPEFDGTSAMALSFYYRCRGTNYPQYFMVGYATESNLSDLTFIDDVVTVTNSAYAEYTNVFPKGTKYVVIDYYATSNYLLLDDFNFTVPTGCVHPFRPEVSDITMNSASLSWLEGNSETQWQICLNGDENNLILVNTNPYTLTGLDPKTAYTVKVRAYCDANSQSEWSEEVSFTTEENTACPAPTALNITDLMPTSATLNWTSEAGQYNVHYGKPSGEAAVFFDGFESGLSDWTLYALGDEPDGWEAYNASSNWSNHTGSYSAASFSWYSNTSYNADNWLISPQVTLQGKLKFWVYSNYSDEYEVKLSTTGTATTDFTVTLQDMTAAASAWTEIVIPLDEYAGQQGYIAIHHVFYDGNVLLVDDFGIYDYTYNWTTVTANENSLAITGLDPESDYGWQVQANCGGDGVSAWSSIAHFTTPSPCDIPNGITAEPTGNAAELSWTGYTDTYNVQYREGDPTAPATIILTAGDVWGDGSGYQMVLDADANMYAQSSISGYDEFEYTIPTGAVFDVNTNTVVINNSVSIEIPAGTYDYFILNPSPDYDKIYIAGSNGNVGGREDNFVFEAGRTYEFAMFLLSEEEGDGVNLTITDNGGTWTTVNGVTNPYTLQNLSSATSYEVQVQGVNCDGNGTSTNWSTSTYFTTLDVPDVPVTAINVTPNEIYPTVGATYSIIYTVLPADATNPAVTFSSSDATVATVDENGTVTAVAAGTAIITIAATDGSGVTGTLTVNVMNIDVEEITASDVTVVNGQTATINYQVLPEQATDKSVTFTSANTAIATVDADGVVTGVGVGETTITIASVSNPEVTKEITVTVTSNPNAVQFTVNAPATAYPGDTITVDFVLAAPTAGTYTGFTGLDVNLYFDNTAFQYNSKANGAVANAVAAIDLGQVTISGPNTNNPNRVKALLVTPANYPVATEGIVFSVTFIVLQDVTSGSYTFNAAFNEFDYTTGEIGNSNTVDIPYDFTPSTVSISFFTKHIIGFGEDNTIRNCYWLIASPIGQVDPTAVTNLKSNTYDLYRFNQAATKEWENYKQNNFSLEVGKGYLYANSQTVDLIFAGEAYNGPGEVTLTMTDGAEFSGWNLVGNPFAEQVYIADGRSFYTMNADGSELETPTSNTIEAMEGIFVIANYDEEPITFTTEQPAKGNGQVAVSVSRSERGVASSSIDRVIVSFDEGRELPKFQLFDDHSKLYILQDGEDYAVVSAEAQGEVPVCFKADENGTYTLSIATEEMDMNYLHLVDNMTGMDVDLLQTPSYSFEARTTDYESRFKLVFAGASAGTENFAFFSNGNWIINNEGEATLQVIDITGRILSSETVSGSVSKAINAASGVYMLRLINGDNVKVQKIVVR